MKASEFVAHAPDEALNQPPALENYNLFASDAPLGEALQREGGGWIAEQAHEFGEILSRAETLRLGEQERAFEWFEKAYQERYQFMVHLHQEPRADSLRSDPRFADLLRRVGLAK